MADVRQDLRPVIVVTGPTATGKTPLAIDLALHFDGEIVNADSMQVFRYMDIGTAKPSPQERARVPHHLLDVVTPDVPYSAGRYAEAARAAASQIQSRGRIVILAGGTGLYIRAFLEGLIETGRADPELRDRLEREHEDAVSAGDSERLYRRLADSDPEAAARIHPNDIRRLVRALEIAARTGRPTSAVRGDHAFCDRPYRALHLALDVDREALTARIDARCAAMIESGLLQEVRDLQERGYGPELRPMKAIGYRHMLPVVAGSDTLANALEAMRRDTRRFARAIWMDPREPSEIHKRVESFLHGDVG
jgi:tRNA dimethylallyltransferase